MENQIIQIINKTDSTEQATPKELHIQQATSGNNRLNADVTAHDQLKIQSPDVTITEILTDTNKQPKQVFPRTAK